VDTILKYLLPIIPLPVVIVLLLLFMPEKIEKWSALLWKCLAGVFRVAHKRYVKHDLQGRVNDFIKQLRQQAPGVTDATLRVEWVDPSTPRSSFLEGNQVVIRLRRDDPSDHNFVHGAYFFVSETLLRKAKRYVSQSQREALDLFVCTKLLEAEKSNVVTTFIDEYLHPGTQETKSKVALYVDDFEIVNMAGLFFPLFVQELEYLGEKVFGKRRQDLIVSEVDGMITFLRPVATRTIGDESDLDFDGKYCRFAIVIVGKPFKVLTSIDPYVRYIANSVIPNGAETIYILARIENKERVEQLCQRFDKQYSCARRIEFKGFLRYSNRSETVPQYLVVLRKQGVSVIQPSE
jgi:hypothetical protein